MKNTFTAVMLFVVLLLLGANLALSLSNRADISSRIAQQAKEIAIVCQEHRVLAEVSREEVDSVIKSNEKYLRPDVNIPGLSHAELIQSTTERLDVLKSHATKLETVRKATC